MPVDGPIRTCVGCWRHVSQRALVRLALVDGRHVVDDERRRGGRGAYLCPRPECLVAARRARRLVGIDDPFEQDLRSVWQRRGFTS